MSLESTHLVVDILSGLGVVVSLIYVGVQIRQSARATRLAAVQAFTQALGRSEEMIIQDGGFAEILKHGLAGNTHALPDTDRIRLNIFYRNALRTFQSAYYQYRNGALEAAVWEPQGRSLAGIFQADRGLREFYEVEKYMLDTAFTEFCERLLRGEQQWIITSGPTPTARRAPEGSTADTPPNV